MTDDERKDTLEMIKGLEFKLPAVDILSRKEKEYIMELLRKQKYILADNEREV